jgi:hypothetical protein
VPIAARELIGAALSTRSVLMFTIRCTRALLDRLHAAPLPADSIEPTTTLGDWYANTFNVGRSRLLMCTSERSLLTVILRARELAQFPERLREAVGRTLASLGVSAPQIAREQREMAWHRFDRTRSRQVLGSMNDFAFLAETYIRDDGPDADLEVIARMLNRAPCRPIGYSAPDRLAPALFSPAS